MEQLIPTMEPMPTPTPAPEPAPLSDWDVKRATLRDLVSLANECAATESEIERTFRNEVEAEKGRYERLGREVRRKYTALREAARQVRDKAVAAAEAIFQTDLNGLKTRDEEIRRKVLNKHAQTVQEVMKKHDQAVWLADSVLENEQNGAASDFKRAKDTVDIHRQSLQELEAQVVAVMKTYKTPIPEPTPEDLEKEKADTPKPEEGTQVYNAQLAAAEGHLNHLRGMRLPKLFTGTTPIFVALVPAGLAAVAPQFIFHPAEWYHYAIVVGAALALTITIMVFLRIVAKRRLTLAYVPFRESISLGRRATAAEIAFATTARDQRLYEGHKKRKEEVTAIKRKYDPFVTDAAAKRDAALGTFAAEYGQKVAEIKAVREKGWGAAESVERAQLADIQARETRDLRKAAEQHTQRTQLTQQKYDQAKATLANRLDGGLSKIRVPADNDNNMGLDWSDPAWRSFVPPTRFPDAVRFGQMTVDLRKIAQHGVSQKAAPELDSLHEFDAPEHGDHDNGDGEAAPEPVQDVKLELPPPFAVPATLIYPRLGSLLIQSDREGRPEAIRAMQGVMARLLTTMPPGRVRFTVIDPIGRGENFAGFMHLADHDDALIGGRIWTEQDQIEQRLADMTEHMETVIQKYLRNEYETIDAYNAQAGELAEPYRILVIADFPSGFEGDAAKRLASVASSGARCGVYTLVHRDTRQSLPADTHLDEIEHHSINVIRENENFVINDEVFKQFPLALDPPPPEELLSRLLDAVGKGAKAAKRVELSFETIAPSVERTWSQSSAEELAVPVGRSGATKLQYVRIGRGVAQHMLIAGKTGSGKSTLLHAMITNLAMWYSPDEVEFYLVDFKKGVEFKTYATHNLPHARAIAVESDREFGLSVLQKLDAELTRRGNLYRVAGTQDLAAYRKSPGAVRMPRTLLMIDEFQEFFSEDDKLAQDASLLMDRLVRQGRAFGIHVLLGSQTIGGSSGLPRSTIGQMAVRVALMTSEADSQLILGDNNSAARLLSRPGEAIYNDAGGMPENNSPFQVAWLPDPKREEYLERIEGRARDLGILGRNAMIVFEGNAAADVTRNARLIEWINAPAWGPQPPATQAFLGDPVAIKDATAVSFRRQSGNNILIVGQQDDAAMALMMVSMISLAAQQSPKYAQFYILDGSAADSSLAGVLAKIKSTLPHEVTLVEYRDVPEVINTIAKQVAERQTASDTADAASIYLFVYGMQRYRMLRKTEESFSFGAADAEKPPEPDKQFGTILREGPAFGVHTIVWADTPATLERTLDRTSLREFDNRILFQMSANDSSNLIDNPAGNKLGTNRALIYSEEQGVMEKFRPYAIPDAAFLNLVKGKMGEKTS